MTNETSTDDASPSLPLKGIVVLDLSQIYNGPYATFLMAMAGATVIKIEPPLGEYLRARSSVGGTAMPFSMLNSGKLGVVIDLKRPEGVALFKRMVAKADVVVENFAANTMERLGLGWSVLRQINPSLIYSAGSGFGRSGPYSNYPAMDLTVQAIAGLMSVTGFPDREPVKCGPAVADLSGGVHLYAATVTALFERERTGQGGMVEVSMQDSVYMTLCSNLGLWYKSGGAVKAPRSGNRHGGLSTSPYNVYPTCDGYLAVICVGDRHWKALTRVMGVPEYGDDPRFLTLKDRVENMDLVDEIVSNWTSQQAKEDAFQMLVDEGVPAAPVRDLDEVIHDTNLHERGMLQRIDHPEYGSMILPHSPLRFEGTTLAPLTPSPALGEHSREAIGALLDIEDAELQALLDQGIFGNP